MTRSRRSRSALVLSLLLASLQFTAACVPKKQLTSKQGEVDACFRALEEENRRKKELADATAELQRKLAELTAALDAAQGTSSQVDKLRAELEAQAKEVARLQTEKEELAKKSQTYDQLVESLKGEIEQGRVKITEANNRLTVELIDKILFDSGSTEIKTDGQNALRKVAGILRTINDKAILVEGHTDAVPISGKLTEKFPTNWELSVARATTVVRFLEDAGVDPNNLGAAGFSRFRPVAGNDSDKGKSQNRRIEIVLTPKVALRAEVR